MPIVDQTSQSISTWSSLTSTGSEVSIIPDDEVIVLEEDPLGEGSYGTVYRGICYHMNVAIKALDRSLIDVDEACLNEVKILKGLRHKNVVSFFGVCVDPPCIIMEYCSHGSLFDLLRNEHRFIVKTQGGPPDTKLWANKLGLLIGVAQGMSFLHTRNHPILHLDLKSPNILVRDNWEAAVGDFGLSKYVAPCLNSINGFRYPKVYGVDCARSSCIMLWRF